MTTAKHTGQPLRLFEGFGVELEYMVVARETLNVLPITDKIIFTMAGNYQNEIEQDALRWSNELALHVIELKTNGPAKALEGLPPCFQKNVNRINEILTDFEGCLMPGGTHPWMNPWTETRLWPHEYNAIYDAYNRIFDCRGHGWSNLQSTHLNLPFHDDQEFARLHAAIRLVLPILPALAASTPVMDGIPTGFLDTRLEVYRFNQKKVPQAAGEIIPENVFSKEAYEKVILQPLYRAIAPYDPDNVLQDEWLNSRGAIARFERNTIEIRLLDIQEYPMADLALIFFITAIIRELVDEKQVDFQAQMEFGLQPLAEIFKACIVNAEDTIVRRPEYLRLFGFPDKTGTAGELLQHLCERLIPENVIWASPLSHILTHGTLAKRIVKSLANDFRRENLKAVYGNLCRCLETGVPFVP